MLVGLYQRIVSDTRLRRRLECSIAPIPPRATFDRKVSIVPIHHTAGYSCRARRAVPLLKQAERNLFTFCVGRLVEYAYDFDVSN